MFQSHIDTLLCGNENTGRKDAIGIKTLHHFEIYRLNCQNLINLIAPKNDTQNEIGISKENIYCIALNPEISAIQFYLVAGIKCINQTTKESIPDQFLSPPYLYHIGIEVLGITNTIQTRHRGNHQHIPSARKQGGSSRQSQLFNLLVDRQIFFDIGIANRQIGLRLVVVVIRNKILYGIFRKERFELAVQLGGECFIVTQHQGWPVYLIHYVGNTESFTRSCNTKQSLKQDTRVQSINKLTDCLGLIACWTKFGSKFERHSVSISGHHYPKNDVKQQSRESY